VLPVWLLPVRGRYGRLLAVRLLVGQLAVCGGSVGTDAGGDGGGAGAGTAGTVATVSAVASAAGVHVVGGLDVAVGVERDDRAAAVAALAGHREGLEQARANPLPGHLDQA
jgi:hypothetical protein